MHRLVQFAVASTVRVFRQAWRGQLLGSAVKVSERQFPRIQSLTKECAQVLTLQLSKPLGDRGIRINSVCPGWVRTDMGGENATRSVAEGAATIVWLATDAPHDLTGKFVKDRKVIPW